ncbi:coagulation factor IX-like [Penaeus japonicus]|uniref:coagulation factor IX-like n=1 Tax=Penaeus japonicus TaxID=27405 RepID=UPI001C71654B|nr:coagulation factor IX-like [Penaeus japonicus]
MMMMVMMNWALVTLVIMSLTSTVMMRDEHHAGAEMNHLSPHAASHGLGLREDWEMTRSYALTPANKLVSFSPASWRRKRKKRKRTSAPKFVERFVRRVMVNKMKDRVVTSAKCGKSYAVKSNQLLKIRLRDPANCNMIFRAAGKAAFRLSCKRIQVGSCDGAQLHLSFGNSTMRRICGGTVELEEKTLTELLLTHRRVPGRGESKPESSLVKCNVVGKGGAGHLAQGSQGCPLICGKTEANADSVPSLYINTLTAVDLVQKSTEDTTEDTTEETTEETTEDVTEETTESFTEADTEITTSASFETNARDPLAPQPSSDLRVQGGSTAAKHEWPWIVFLHLLIKGSLLFCGGTIITPRFVLTAAHCVFDVDIEKGDKVVVKANEYDIRSKDETVVQSIRVQKIIVHPNYQSKTQRADIALLMLRKALVFGRGVAPICLPPKHDFEDFNTIVLGWGSLSFNGKDPRRLQKGTLRVTNLRECARNYTKLQTDYMITKKHVCTASPGVDSCLGDSGGPIIMQLGTLWYQLGIVSFGEKCAVPGYPGVNTNVAQYTPWILRKISNGNCK